MSVSETQIVRVRTLSGVDEDDFDDAAVTLAIEEYPVSDPDGVGPDDDDWVPTYDLYRAAADIAEQRAAVVAVEYDTSADGATLSRSQLQEQLYQVAVRLRARSKARVFRREIEYVNDEEED